MADFPLFIKMDGRKVMVIGGGSVALRKIRILTDYGADIRIISGEVRNELKMMAEAGRLEWQKENLTEKHLSELDEAFLVICASNDETVSAMAANYCQRRHILVDCAKPGENSDCVFPSVVRRGNVVVGISTSGGVPALTRHLREKIEAVMPEWYGDFERALRDKRRQLKQSDLSQGERRQSLRQWIAEEEKIREKGRESYENRNEKEPSGYGADGDGSKGH